MSFNSDEYAAGLSTFGRKGHMIDYSGGDQTLTTSVKAVVVCSAGNVVYVPRGETASITMSGVSPGTPLPHIPGKIVQSGTTAALCTVED